MNLFAKNALIFISILYLLSASLYVLSFGITLRFSSSFLISIPFAFVLTRLWIGWRRGPSLKNSLVQIGKSDLQIMIGLYFFAFFLLALKMYFFASPATYDEIVHMGITRTFLTFDFSSIIGELKIIPNPPLPYVVMAAVFSHFELTLQSARIASSIISSAVPVVLYYWMKVLHDDRVLAIQVSATYIFTPLYQNLAYLYTFDGLSTLLFTLLSFYFVRGIQTKKGLYFILSGILFAACGLTKYPPALWFLLSSMAVVALSFRRKSLRLRNLLFLPIGLTPLLLIFLVAGPHFAVAYEYGSYWNATMVYAVISDLFFVLGWSPYLIFLSTVHRSILEGVDEKSVFFILVITLAFLTPFVNPYTRRLVQVIPVFFIAVTERALEIDRQALAPLVYANLSWWGILSLLSYYL